MKKILTCIALCIAIAAHSNPLPDNIYQAIVTKFNASFPESNDVKWYSGQDEYIVSFKKSEMRYKIYYDHSGNVTSTISYYTEAHLSPFIALKLSEQFNALNVKGVTEVQDANGQHYSIIMENEKYCYIVEGESDGNMHVKNKFKRA